VPARVSFLAGPPESYLNGTADPARFLPALQGALAVGPWEEPICAAGSCHGGQWLETR